VQAALPRIGPSLLASGVAVLLVLNLPPNLPLHEADRNEWSGWLTHVIRRVPLGVVAGRLPEDRYLRGAVPSYAAWQYINGHLPLDARILVFGGGDDFYSARGRLWSDAVAARPATWGSPAGREDQALRALRRLRITHILFERTSMPPAGAVAIAEAAFLARSCVREYLDPAAALYRIEWRRILSGPPAPVK
jgi:hypothetical protein